MSDDVIRSLPDDVRDAMAREARELETVMSVLASLMGDGTLPRETRALSFHRVPFGWVVVTTVPS